MSAAPPLAFPLVTGLALLLLVGYLLRTLFVSLNLPGPVGVLLSGWLCGKLGLLQTEILQGRDHFQECAFFLVLLTAGFEISHNIPRTREVIMGIIPCCSEFVGISVWAYYVEELSGIEACVTGAVLCGLADGIVIPKMIELMEQQIRAGKPPGLARLVLTTAPLEASFVLTLFGLLSGFAELSKSSVSPATVVSANLVRFVATVVIGGALGGFTGWIMKKRDLSAVFTCKPEETYLLILAVALATFGLGLPKDSEGAPLVPIGFAPGSLFQPELLVIVLGCSFSHARPLDTDLLKVVGGVWVFGQIFLFSMIGSKMDLTVVLQSLQMAPMMITGLVCRFCGVSLAILLSHRLETKEAQAFNADSKRMLWFLFLSSLPRASLQGALGFVPQQEHFFHSDASARKVRSFIADSSRLYIIVMSVVGSMLLHYFGPSLLQEDPQDAETVDQDAEEAESRSLRAGSADSKAPRKLSERKSVSFLGADVQQSLEQTRSTRTCSDSVYLMKVESDPVGATSRSADDLASIASGANVRRTGTGTYSVPLLVEDEGLQALETLAAMFGHDPSSFCKRLYDTFGLPESANPEFFNGVDARMDVQPSAMSQSMTHKESLLALYKNRF